MRFNAFTDNKVEQRKSAKRLSVGALIPGALSYRCALALRARVLLQRGNVTIEQCDLLSQLSQRDQRGCVVLLLDCLLNINNGVEAHGSTHALGIVLQRIRHFQRPPFCCVRGLPAFC